MEELNKDKDKEKKEEKKETKEESFVKNNESEPIKIKIGTVGNFILTAFVVLIIGTGALTYYLVHQEKENYNKLVNKIVKEIEKECPKFKIRAPLSQVIFTKIYLLLYR